MVVTAAVLTTLLKDPLTKALGWTFSEALKGSRNQKIEKSLESLSKRITDVIKVKTFYQIDESIDLHRFYVPTRVNDVSINIDTVSKIDSKSIVLEGTVGQGKSIFMRYLTYQEAQQGQKVPIFFELRRLENSQSLEEAITSTISNWIPFFSEENFDKVAQSGHLVLFLDGFDEIPHERIQNIINEIEGWCVRYPKMQLIISARPESEIQKSTYFKTYKLSSYTLPEQDKLIEKLIPNRETQYVLKKAIKNSSTQIKYLLKTPLMVTLFVMQYKATLAIPENQSEFYENLFYSLILRHDNTKAGFRRQLNSGLDVSTLQGLFEEFCFITKNSEKLVLSKPETVRMISDCLTSQEIQNSTENILKDFSTVVCLLLKDGLEYSFIHRSIQDYFYSSYINKKSEKAKKEFYKACLQNERFSNKVDNVLSFLERSDTYNYNKFFYIPIIDQYINFYQINYNDNTIIDNIYLFNSSDKNINYLTVIHMDETVSLSSKFTSIYISPLMRDISKSVSPTSNNSSYAMSSDTSLKIQGEPLKKHVHETLATEIYKKSIDAGNAILQARTDFQNYIVKKDGLNIDYGKFK
ncbi:NACHT domain-containing protein [Psychrobacter sp. SCQQ22]|uniref:NACHT domain-containing protein n=1 Tax=Psychrobacter sp. SCQQ22 TaxID=2792059 RepID=UPI0018CF233D|nr:NACHT domain-containing protein [Psychrobacter sp. SCQQ22]MBH0086743.1 NACHT domain-containing protein [Psychrobacter sp. SCQQ22]